MQRQAGIAPKASFQVKTLTSKTIYWTAIISRQDSWAAQSIVSTLALQCDHVQ